jgi:DNA-binding NtrC family response regulator
MNVKILAATNKNLTEMVQRGLFRADLFYRLQVINIHLPPLRERKDDIAHLTGHIVEKVCRKHGRLPLLVDPEVIKALTAYNWPGNVRELENVLTRAVTVCDGNTLNAGHIKPLLKSRAISAAGEEILPLADMEQTMIRRALVHYGSTTAGKKAAAQALHVSLGTLYNKIRLYRLEK